jgi:DNA-binding CsgD family transcriptional regulator
MIYEYSKLNSNVFNHTILFWLSNTIPLSVIANKHLACVAMYFMTTAERQSLLSTALASARTGNAFARALGRIATAFGLSHFSVFNAPAAEDATLASLIIETSWSPHFIRDFDRANMLCVSPMVVRLRQSVMPQSWHLLERRTFPSVDVPPALHRLLVDYNMPMGISCPINMTGERNVVFCFMGDRGSLAQSELNEFYMIVLQAVDAYNCINSLAKAPQHPLSARELEVVRWTAEGKTSVEIAQILSLSDHTINAYMNNAMRKLDCVNRTHLVAKAMRLGVIS